MSNFSADYVVVFETADREQCRESRLVLEAVGIATALQHTDGVWQLAVPSDAAPKASDELEAYRRENRSSTGPRHERIAVYSGAVLGIVIYAVTILTIAFLDSPAMLDFNLMPAGEMQAGKVMAGEYWRTVTALTLHVDAGHAIANLVFGGLFGFLAGRVLGGGVAWLAIVLAGSLGNAINAALRDATHTSVGASTAVFAALGVTIAHSLKWRGSNREKSLRRWSPLVGGLVLFGYLGMGEERTDVGAHAAGIIAGLIAGWAAARLPHRWLADNRIQQWTGLTAVAIVIVAWTIGLYVASTQ